MTETVTSPPQPVEDQMPREEYWGFDETKRWYFPDKVQYIEYKIMNEGDKAKFQRQTNRDVVLDRKSGDARFRMDQASERHALLEACVTGWYLFRNGAEVLFVKGSPGTSFSQWLNSANPKLVEELEFDIRKSNPWLQSEMTVEEIDKEMDRLRELRQQVVEREEGKSSSSDR